jgi:hypothetical protein
VGVLIIGLLVVGLSLNLMANKKADEFCKSITAGDSISSLVDKAERDHIVIIHQEESSKYIFLFRGFLYGRTACVVTVENGLVRDKGHRKNFD